MGNIVTMRGVVDFKNLEASTEGPFPNRDNILIFSLPPGVPAPTNYEKDTLLFNVIGNGNVYVNNGTVNGKQGQCSVYGASSTLTVAFDFKTVFSWVINDKNYNRMVSSMG